MIINLRGTSGAGKTHLARQVMERYDQRIGYTREGRKRPIGYVFTSSERPEGRPLAVIGHYESVCGGCDTIKEATDVMDLVRQSAGAGYDVLYEGLLISADVNHTVALNEWTEQTGRGPLSVVHLTTPLQLCLDSVNARRRARNPDLPPVKEKNTTSKHRAVERSIERISQAGVTVFQGERDPALAHVLTLLGIPL